MENKYQEALNHISELAEYTRSESSVKPYKDKLQELVDKEISVKPITLEPCHYECSKCYSTILPIGHKRTWYKQFNKYCPNCGQRIDWSEEEWRS